MVITKKEVEKIAALARLKLTKTEIEAAVQDLNGILSHFSAIQEIDTSSASTTAGASGRTNISRKDEPNQGSIAPAKDTLNAAPETKDKQLKVKSVF